MRSLRAWVGILAVLCLSACAPRGDDAEGPAACDDCPWVRVDLTAVEARIDLQHPERWPGAAKAHPSFLGPREVRDLERIGPQPVPLSASMIDVLDQQARSRLAFSLELGAEPVFRFVPLGIRRGHCDTCTFVVGVRADDTVEAVLRLAVNPVGLPAPAPVSVPLDRWAGRSVELLLAVDGPPGARASARVEWGSPEVFWRRDGERDHRADEADEADEGPDATEAAAERPNILLLGVDTFRADIVGALGGREPSVTPNLDRLAAQSDLWEQAFSTFNNTNPSFTSILTGLYGKHHGIYDLKTRLPEEYVTLAEILSDAGYDTLSVLAARHLGPYASNLGQGFDVVDLPPRRFAAERVVDRALAWLGEREDGPRRQTPFFAWLHFFDPHTPHSAPLPYAAGLGPGEPVGFTDPSSWRPFRPVGLRSYREVKLGGHHELYPGQVAYFDRHLGRLLDYLETNGWLEDTIIALVADHGENLDEHGLYTSHNGLWDSTTHVPLLIRPPGTATREGRRFSGLVQTLDLFPTLLAQAGLQAPPSDGRDLYELTADGKGRRVVISENAGGRGLSVRTPRYRLYRSRGNHEIPDGSYLYDLEADPRETTDIAAENPDLAAELERLLDRWLADVRVDGETARPSDLTAEEEENLRALGYVQ